MWILLLCYPLTWSTLIIMYSTQCKYGRRGLSLYKIKFRSTVHICFNMHRMPCWKVFVGRVTFFKLKHHHFRNWSVTCLILGGLNMACHLFQTWAQLQKFRFATCLMLGGLYMVLRPVELQSNHFRNCIGMFSKVYREILYALNIATVLMSPFFLYMIVTTCQHFWASLVFYIFNDFM